SDQRPFIGSPRLIADFHVLHRLLMPRHPPCALTHSPPTRVSSMCARNVSNTLVFDDKKITLHKQHKNVVDARVHYTILKPLPNTTQEPTASAASTRPGWSCWLKPHPHGVCDSRTQYRICS